MSRREPPTTTGIDINEIHKQMREAMLDQAGPMENQVIFDKEVYLIDDVISALKKIEGQDCTEDVYETIQAAITDLTHCL